MAVQEAEELQVSNTKQAIPGSTWYCDSGLMNMTFPTLSPRDSIEGPTKVPDRLQYGRYE